MKGRYSDFCKWVKKYANLHITYLEDGESEFKAKFEQFLYQVSQNRDQNSQ